MSPNAIASVASARLNFTVFARFDITKGHREDGTYDYFVNSFRSPLERPDGPEATKEQIKEKKKKLPLVAPAIFRNDLRDLDHLIEAYCIGLDGDNGVVPRADEMHAALAEFQGFFYPSFQHTVESPRWRVMLLLSRPVNAAEYKTVLTRLRERFSWIGREASDASRQWYVGCKCRDGSYELEELCGQPLDVDAMLKAPARPDVVKSDGNETTPPDENSDFTIDRWIEEAAQILAPAFKDGRRDFLSMALAGGCRWDGLPKGDVVKFIDRVATLGPDFDADTHAKDRTKHEGHVRKAYAKIAAGKHVTGWPTVAELAGDDIATRCRDALLGYNWVAKHLSVVLEKTPANDADVSNDSEKRGMSPAERARSLGSLVARLPTTFPTLDRITRGGIPLGKTVVIGGAPGAGKTTTAVQLAHHYLSRGVHVAILAADEEADGLLVRFAQLIGVGRDDIEKGDPEARAKLAAWCDSVHLHLWDQDDDGMTIEDASAKLRDEGNGEPSILIVDSVQTARTKTGARIENIRERINDTVSTLKRVAKVDGHAVIATSELTRAAYRNQDTQANVDPLAAFKESGGIEYGFGLALVLRNRKGEAANIIDVEVAKNRFGGAKTGFVLELDFDTAGVKENAFAQPTTPLGNRERIRAQILALDLLVPRSKNGIVGGVTGGKKMKLDILNELIARGVLVEDVAGGVRSRLFGDPEPLRA